MSNVDRPTNVTAETALPPGGDACGDIDDEIGDHLALAARDLQLAGHASDEARGLALAKFGDVDQIRRKCWWIQQGDAVMARAALGLAIAVLILAVVGLGIGGWRMNAAINDLGDTLSAINESQKALFDSQKQVNRPLVIRGRLYIGDKSKPADYAEVHLYRLPEGKLVERISADNEGRFITPPLEAGSYFLIAPLVGELNPSVHQGERFKDDLPLFAVQSWPISVFPWADLKEVDLDLAMIGVGQISYELTHSLPNAIQLKIPPATEQKWREELSAPYGQRHFRFANGTTILATLVVLVPQDGPEKIPMTDVWKQKISDWPKRGFYGYSPLEWNVDVGPNPNFRVLTPGRAELFESATGGSYAQALRRGTYRVGAFIKLSVEPSIGPWRDDIRDTMNQLPETAIVTVEVENGKRAHLKITPPDDLDEVRAVLDNAIDSEERLAEIVDKIRPAKVEVVGQMEMTKQ